LPVRRTQLQRLDPAPLRRFWKLAPGTTFLNHGSFGACPTPILELQNELRRQMEAEPVQFLWRRYEARLEPSREIVADFLGARAQDVVFVTNATTAVNAVVRSMKLRPGDQLLTTNLDYNACHNAFAEEARRAGAELITAEVPFPVSSADAITDAILRRVTKRTRLAMLDHITSNTALVLPVQQLVRELDSRGVASLVDGAHAPGMLPLNLQKLHPAYYTGNLHKWVCAPKGAAFLWAREDMQTGLQPAVVSHGNNTHRAGYTEFQDRFDWAGTFDPTAWMCAGEAIRWMEKLLPGGWPTIRKRNNQMAIQARDLLCQRLNLEAPSPKSLLGSMATLPLPERFQGKPRNGRIDAEQLRLYDDFGIEVPFMRFGQPERRHFRVSAQLYNTIEDYDYLARALRMLEESK
jgi:isopenicillin-N epimerase